MLNSLLENPKLKDTPLEFKTSGKVYYNLPPAALVEHSLKRNEGYLTSTGALMADTGKFTGRSPKDRFIVKDEKNKRYCLVGRYQYPF